MINVILLEKVGRLGQIGTQVKVKPGYARNYLLPRKKALRATKENLAYFESQRAAIEAANASARAEAEKKAKNLDGKKFVLIRQASEVGQLFGSVAVRDVAQQLKEAGYDVERQNVMLAAPIKSIGLFKIEVKLHSEVSATVTLNIARTEDEAKVQEKTGQAAKFDAQTAQLAEASRKAQDEMNKKMLEQPAPDAEKTAEKTEESTS